MRGAGCFRPRLTRRRQHAHTTARGGGAGLLTKTGHMLSESRCCRNSALGFPQAGSRLSLFRSDGNVHSRRNCSNEDACRLIQLKTNGSSARAFETPAGAWIQVALRRVMVLGKPRLTRGLVHDLALRATGAPARAAIAKGAPAWGVVAKRAFTVFTLAGGTCQSHQSRGSRAVVVFQTTRGGAVSCRPRSCRCRLRKHEPATPDRQYR